MSETSCCVLTRKFSEVSGTEPPARLSFEVADGASQVTPSFRLAGDHFGSP